MGGFSIGYGIWISPRTAAFDADALAYFATAGVTDPTAQTQINDFVKGIKNLGLWSSMVSWPLRSSQNKGSGTTAYSLGGLQTSNATMTGGTWTSDGLSLSNTQHASSTLTSVSQDLTLILCASGDGTAYNSYPVLFSLQSQSSWVSNQVGLAADGFGSEMACNVRNSANGFVSTTNGTNPLNSSTSFAFLTGTYKLSTTLNFKNLSSGQTRTGTAPSSGTATLDRMQLNGRYLPPIQLLNPIRTAFCAVITPNINGSESSVYSLYKTTLGQGLGLP